MSKIKAGLSVAATAVVFCLLIGCGGGHQEEARAVDFGWFEQTSKEIQETDARIVAAEEKVVEFKKKSPADQAKWSFDQRQEYQRLNSIVVGLRAYRRTMAQDYNLKASMIKQEQWKSKLPRRMDED